jgi:putative ABC transport system permease protein
LVERSALALLGTRPGASLHVRAPGGHVADLRVSGVVLDAGQAPGWQDQTGYAYATPATLAALGQGAHLDELRVAVGEGRGRERAAAVAAELAAWLEAEGRRVERVEIMPGEHPHADHMKTMLAVLQAFSALALTLSGTLAANVMAALLAKQVRQVGIMKAIGATTSQVAGLYLAFVLPLALAAVALGMPAGSALARWFAAFVADQMLNLDVRNLAIPARVVVGEALIGIGVPLIAAAVPIVRAARVTAREAIQHVGMALPVAAKRAAPGRAPWPSWADRRVSLALRNTFRRPARLALTVGALSLGGAMLMTAANVYEGLVLALARSLAARGGDVEARLLRPAPTSALEARARALPGVADAEAWGLVLASLELPTSAVSRSPVGTSRYGLFAPPEGTRLFGAPLVKGRRPEPGERNVVLVNRTFLADERGLDVGASVTLVAAGRRATVTIVGAVEEVAPPSLYTNRPTLDALSAQAGGAGALRLVAEPGRQRQVAAALEEALIDAGWFPTLTMTREAFARSATDHFAIVLLVLATAAAAAFLVGGLGLATSMSLNVLERAREIGVLRAIGATRRAVLGVLVLEGAALALASALLASAIALPLSAGLGRVVGEHGLHATLPFTVSRAALGAWFGLVALVTALACLVPSRRALRHAVRDVLAHE